MKITKEELIAAAIELAKKVDEYNKKVDDVIFAGGESRRIHAIRINHNLDLETCKTTTDLELFISNDNPVQPEETVDKNGYYEYAHRQEDGINIIRLLPTKEEKQ